LTVGVFLCCEVRRLSVFCRTWLASILRSYTSWQVQWRRSSTFQTVASLGVATRERTASRWDTRLSILS